MFSGVTAELQNVKDTLADWMAWFKHLRFLMCFLV